MTIRPATAADAPAIAAIWNHYIRETTVTFLPDEKSVEDVEKMIATDVCLVADDGGVQGFARYFQFRRGRGYVHTVEHTVLLAAGTAGRGFGRGLMKALMAHAVEAGKHSMWAGVSGENSDGVAFHVALGFEEIARLPEVGFKFGRWIDLVLMQKRL